MQEFWATEVLRVWLMAVFTVWGWRLVGPWTATRAAAWVFRLVVIAVAANLTGLL